MIASTVDIDVVPPQHDDLARRPCLRPGIHAYQRAVDEVQLGVNPRRAALLTDLPPRLVSVVRSLDGQTPLGRLLARAGPRNAVRLCRLLRDMAADGFLIDASEPRRDQRLSTATMAVRGDGPLAAGVAVQLAYAGVGHIAVESSGTVTTEDLCGVFGTADLGRPRRQLIEQAVLAASGNVTTGAVAGERSPDLVVLTDVLVPEPETVRRLMHERQEHVIVAARDGCGIVGPLVLPGRSACLECFDRYRTDRDRHWPRVANQLAGSIQRADPATTQATAAFATAQVLRCVQPIEVRPPLLEATIELDLGDGETLRREWLPHPWCACGVGDQWGEEAA
ncbi:MAG: TOMM precursor leader peptide-binding protein [Thermocrispum sp.]